MIKTTPTHTYTHPRAKRKRKRERERVTLVVRRGERVGEQNELKENEESEKRQRYPIRFQYRQHLGNRLLHRWLLRLSGGFFRRRRAIRHP